MGQAPAHVPHQGVSEAGQTLGHADAVHDLPGQDEERHGHKGEEIQAFEVSFGRHDQKIVTTDLVQAGHAGDAQDKADGHARQKQPEKEKYDNGHLACSLTKNAGSVPAYSRTMHTRICTQVRMLDTVTERKGTNMVMPKMVAYWVAP